MKTTAITGDTLLTAAAVEKVCPTEYGKFRQALSDRPIKTLDEFKDLKENIAAGDAADHYYADLAEASSELIDALNAKGLDVVLSFIERDELVVFQFVNPPVELALRPEATKTFDKLGIGAEFIYIDNTDA